MSAGQLIRGEGAWGVWLATFGGVGFAPAAPGTAGSLVAALLYAWLRPGDASLLVVAIVLVSAVGVVACGVAGRATRVADDGRFVIDEVAGQWIALLPVATLDGPLSFDLSKSEFAALVVTAFVVFRVFDIAKPGPVAWAERSFAGGLGVMADDWVAGALAAVTLAGLIAAAAAAGLLGGAA